MLAALALLAACADPRTEGSLPVESPIDAAVEARQAATTIREGASRVGVDWPPPDLSVYIDKSDRELTVRSGETALVTWPIGLGGSPAGDKVRQGDQRTPVGTFWIVTRNPKSAYHLFLGISYPDGGDAQRGLDEGWLSTSQAASIETAAQTGVKPPWNTTLGGAIGIHGGGSASDWTLGCIALDNPAIEELWDLAPHGTQVVIVE